MAQREKFCKTCGKYYFYEDGVDTPGVGLIRTTHGKDGNLTPSHDQCPTCYDPHFLPGCSYYKEYLFDLFCEHLKENRVEVEGLDIESIEEMMTSFPRIYRTYVSNDKFLSFTLYPGDKFDGKYGQFELGDVEEITVKEETTSPRQYVFKRMIRCCRCGRISKYDKQHTLEFVLGMIEKCCQHCDSKHYVRGNIDNLNRSGSKKSDFSERALAKALNVSRNDYRRNRPSKRVAPLANGTIVAGLKILDAYWDDDPSSYCPKYLLECPKCLQRFRCIQKNVDRLAHRCG